MITRPLSPELQALVEQACEEVDYPWAVAEDLADIVWQEPNCRRSTELRRWAVVGMARIVAEHFHLDDVQELQLVGNMLWRATPSWGR